MIEILDTTLREGQQTPNVSFLTKQKIETALMLDEFGVDFIEAGHPIISKKIENDVKEICDLNLKAKIVGHARANIKDIDKVLECGCEWVGIFMGINELSLKHKYNLSKEKAEIRFLDALSYAKKSGLKVRCSIEDGTRTSFEEWTCFAKKIETIGVDRLSVVDTVGMMTPIKMYNHILKIKEKIKIPLHVHCHNDFGMSVANSLSAFEAGVKCIDVAINGLGERAGIASISTVSAALNVLYGIKKWDLKVLPRLSKMVENFTGLTVPLRQPIVGEDVFTHKGGLHAKAALENPDTYEILHPELVGAQRKFVLGEYSSKKVLEEHLKQIKPDITKDEIEKAFYLLKNNKNNKDIIWHI